MNEPPLIQIRGLVKTFDNGRVRALDGVDVDLARGEFIAVIGPSGCGKSTLLHLVAALERPDSGSICVDGRDLSREPNLSRYRAREVGLVFQLDNLIPSLSAEENIQIPMFELPFSPPERRARTADRQSSPEGRDSGWQWPARWPTIRRSCWRTSQRAAWIPSPASAFL